MLASWARLVARRATAVLLISLVVVAGAGVFGLGVFGQLANGGFDDPASESARELVAEQAAFGNQGADVVAVYSSKKMTVDDPAFRAEVQRVVAGFPEGATVRTLDYWSTQDPALVSRDRHATEVVVSLAGKTQDDMAKRFEELKPTLRAGAGLDTDVAGTWAVYDDVNTVVSKDLARAEMISMPVVLLLSLVIFGSVVAALMPMLVGGVAVLGGLAVVRLVTGVTDVSVFSINVITLLGMGLAIDYALFVISRFREELARLPEDDPAAAATAVQRTLLTAGRTVLFSGLTVAAAMASLLVFPQNFLRSLAFGGIAAVVVAMVGALTILPAVLRLLGRRIDAGRMPWARRRPVAVVGSDHGAWARLGHSVMRRPVAYLVVIVVGLLALASPFLGVKWGSVDHRVLPPDAPAHVAAEKITREFGAEQSTANVLVSRADKTQVASYAAALGRVEGVVDVRPIAERGEDTLLRVAWEGNSQTEKSQQVVQDLREVAKPAGTAALVGGLTAATVDLLDSIGDRLPWMGLIVVSVMFVLLFLAFGSLVLPLKAIAMNALSITASFGVVTWIFADGHLEDLLGFSSSGFLDATQPILMLAILFGLSMDYEVFLLSRVREQWDRGLDNTAAVAGGLQRTGRIITSAAVLLAVVIGAFGLSGIVFMKMIGIGMLVALLLDATIVRALLVPATMKLLGHWNWWAPGPMQRWWERHGLREESGDFDDVVEESATPAVPAAAG